VRGKSFESITCFNWERILVKIESCETWPMKEGHEVKLDGNKMSTLGWMCDFNLKDRNENMEIRKLLGLEPVSLSVKRGRLQWFQRVEYKDDADRVKRCMLMETEGTRLRGRLKKT